MDIQLIQMDANLIRHNTYFQEANVNKTAHLYNYRHSLIILLISGLNKYKKKVYKKTKNLLTGNTEQDEEYQKVSYNDRNKFIYSFLLK